jgi:hypothetical protein
MTAVILKFSGLYYPQVRQDLVQHRRLRAPELTDENPEEPGMQLYDGFALAAHNVGVLTDHVAQETLMPSARLRESVRAHLLVIGRTIAQPTAAVAELLLTLSAPITIATELPAGYLAATEETDELPSILFEVIDAVPLPLSNELTQAWEDDGGVFTDRTAESNGVGTYTPFGTALEGDALYFGHERVLWDDMTLEFTGAVTELFDDTKRVWEYFDGNLNVVAPSIVDELIGVIELNVNSLLGTVDRHGTVVRVTSLLSGAFEDVVSVFAPMTAGGLSVNKVTTSDLLGQLSPVSEQLSDYLVGTEWRELDSLVEDFAASPASVNFSVPQTVARNWRTTEVNGVTAFWIRLRVINDHTVPMAVLGELTIDEGDQFIVVSASQGETFTDDPIALSTGDADQVFITTREDVIESTGQLFVDEAASGSFVEYPIVADFLSSGPNSRHATLEFDVDGFGIFTTGDGVAGKLPPVNAPIRLDYRSGAAVDGNVGPDTITVNRGSSALAAAITNPRGATGWREAEGASPEGLEQLKISGPASLRIKQRAVSLQDYEDLAVSFVAANGSSPVARAKAIGEGFGPKTVKLVVVGNGGAALPVATLAELDLFFNGDPIEDVDGVGLLNTEATSVNYTPILVDVVATTLGGDEDTMEASVRAFLNPLAKRVVNGVETDEFLHNFGGTLFLSRISTIIDNSDADSDDIAITTPAVDVALGPEGLPTAGPTIDITPT